MGTVDLGEFDKFVAYGKTLELLDRYGIRPTSVDVGLRTGTDDNCILWGLFDKTRDYPNESSFDLVITDPEQHEKVKRLYADLGGGLGIDDVEALRFSNYTELYNKLCDAIEKAPKSFASRFR